MIVIDAWWRLHKCHLQLPLLPVHVLIMWLRDSTALFWFLIEIFISLQLGWRRRKKRRRKRKKRALAQKKHGQRSEKSTTMTSRFGRLPQQNATKKAARESAPFYRPNVIVWCCAWINTRNKVMHGVLLCNELSMNVNIIDVPWSTEVHHLESIHSFSPVEKDDLMNVGLLVSSAGWTMQCVSRAWKPTIVRQVWQQSWMLETRTGHDRQHRVAPEIGCSRVVAVWACFASSYRSMAWWWMQR